METIFNFVASLDAGFIVLSGILSIIAILVIFPDKEEEEQ